MDAATLAAMNLPATGSVPEVPKPKAPTLKDYLPYMKPKTFGPKGQVPSQPPTGKSRGYSFTARPCFGEVGTHPTGMLSCLRMHSRL